MEFEPRAIGFEIAPGPNQDGFGKGPGIEDRQGSALAAIVPDRCEQYGMTKRGALGPRVNGKNVFPPRRPRPGAEPRSQGRVGERCKRCRVALDAGPKPRQIPTSPERAARRRRANARRSGIEPHKPASLTLPRRRGTKLEQESGYVKGNRRSRRRTGRLLQRAR